MRRIEALAKRLEKLEATKEIEGSLVLASGLSINIGGAGLARLFREIDGKTRGIPSQQGNRRLISDDRAALLAARRVGRAPFLLQVSAHEGHHAA